MIKGLVDTNVLIDNPEIILDGKYEYYLAFKTIQELDNLKRREDLQFVARNALKIIREAHKEGKLTITDIPKELNASPDEIIISAAKNIDAVFISNDLGANLVAEANGVKTEATEHYDNYDRDYKGYQEISIATTDWANLEGIKELQEAEVKEYYGIELGFNEYLIMYEGGDESRYHIWKKNREGHIVLVNTSLKFLRAVGVGAEPLDAIQFCALDAVVNTETPLCIIDGVLGSGKTLWGTIGALAVSKAGQNNRKLYDKIYVTRPNRPVSKEYALGFRPGDLNDKMDEWLLGFKSNLQFLFECTKKDAEEKEAEKVFNEYFTPIAIETVQGLNIHNSILLVDEYQLLDKDAIIQVISRPAHKSKAVLMGDTENQVYGVNRGREGFKILHPVIKNNPLISYVKLEKVYRSELAELIYKLMNS